LLVFVLIAGYVVWALERSLPLVQPVQAVTNAKTAVPGGNLSWPPTAEATVSVLDTDILSMHGQQTPAPTASTAKLITALAVLSKKPLKPGEQGPIITLTDKDVAIYNAYVALDGSVMRVVAGEQLSEYQMLQAIMLPSANNIADSLAIWAFGSLEAYSTYANTYIEQLGMNSTHIGSDASGLSPTTVSSAHDLALLGKAAMQNPVLAGIVSQPSANGFPVVGTIRNVNYLLGKDGIVGVKTGNTDQAGGVFVGASRGILNGKSVVIVTAVTGSANLPTAMQESLNLIQSAQANFKPITAVKAGTVVGSYKLPWGGTVEVVAAEDLRTSGWAGGSVPYSAKLQGMAPGSQAGTQAGTVSIKKSGINDGQSTAVELKSSISEPSAWWRLLHPWN
jgi:D-alanyl-D-alanine carboxypeptidase (penicillin-binding protein 5/6)